MTMHFSGRMRCGFRGGRFIVLLVKRPARTGIKLCVVAAVDRARFGANLLDSLTSGRSGKGRGAVAEATVSRLMIHLLGAVVDSSSCLVEMGGETSNHWKKCIASLCVCVRVFFDILPPPFSVLALVLSRE